LQTTVASPTITPSTLPAPAPSPAPTLRLLLSNSSGYHITRLDPTSGQFEQLEVGAAPWGIALSPDRATAYVATAEGVAVVDLATWQRTALVPYSTPLGAPQFGEYRPGGMGIAISPDGDQLYVGVYTGNAASQLEIIDIARQVVTSSFAVGVRPFQVLASPDNQYLYSIDHDSFTVTVINVTAGTTETLSAAPLGTASFDKPHYAVLDDEGHLLLPYQGRLLLDLDPLSGNTITRPLTANTHQHGIAWTPDHRTLLIVGTGPAGSVDGGTSLTLLEWATGSEEVLPLARPHEHVAVSPDGRWAYLTGGYSFANGGWDGITVLDLVEQTTHELAVPDRPLDIVVLP
jgi:DNA-binding beta-propeller fold protein YncE